MTVVNKWRLRCQDEGADVHWWLEEGAAAPTTCPNDSGHTIDGEAVQVSSEGEAYTHDAENALVARLKKASWAKNYCKRLVVFTSSKLGSIEDNEWNGDEGSGRSLKFYKDDAGSIVQITGDDLNQTFLDTNCVETHLEVRYDSDTIEIDTASLKIPDTLPVDEAAWKYALTIAAGTGFDVALSNEMPMRFFKGERMDLGRSFEIMKVEPDKLGGQVLPGGHVMHFIVKHPAGQQVEFLLEGICYK